MSPRDLDARRDDRRQPARDRSPVTVIGLGSMGRALARAFLTGGHPTTVWNRTPGRADDLLADGAVLAPSAASAVAASPLVVVCLLDSDAVVEVLEPLGAELDGRTLVNLTSSTPERAREIAAWASARGAAYLDGAIMVTTAMVGTPDAQVLYSGPGRIFDDHRETLASLAPDSDHLGEDPGLASLYELGMLDLFFVGMTGFLHAATLVGADGVDAATFVPYARRITALLDAILADLAEEVDAGAYPGTEDNVVMELVSLDHIVRASEARGVDTAVPGVVRSLLREAVDRGHGRDGFTRVVEQLRHPAA